MVYHTYVPVTRNITAQTLTLPCAVDSEFTKHHERVTDDTDSHEDTW